MKKFLKIFVFSLIIFLMAHFIMMSFFLRIPLPIPERLTPNRVLLAIWEYNLKKDTCGLFCFINESWKITLAYFKKDVGGLDYAKILNDQTKSARLKAEILSLVISEMQNKNYVLEEEIELYQAILKIAADKNEDPELRLTALDILRLVERNDAAINEIAREIINAETEQSSGGLKTQAIKLLVKENPGDPGLLFDLLKSPDVRISDNAGALLIRKYPFETYQRIEELVKIAKNENLRIGARAGAINLIGYLSQIFDGVAKKQGVISALEDLLVDNHGAIREMANDILEEVTGQRYQIQPATEEELEEL